MLTEAIRQDQRRKNPWMRRIGPAVLLSSLLAGRAGAYDWRQMNGDPQHSGNNTQESVLSASNVANLQVLFQASLPSVADGAPAVLTGVSTPGGMRDVLFLTTRAGHILALDAHTGAQIWSHQYPAGSCHINNGSSACYTTSSPAIDPNRLYVYSYGLDGKVHKYQVGDGTEVMIGGWPETTTLKDFNEKGSSALAIATATSGASYLYVTNGGYPGDAGDYQGHVTAINLTDGSQKVFNALCSNQTVHFVESPGTPDCGFVQSAIWARVGLVYDSVTDRIFMGTGNGTYDGNSGGHEWGDSVFALNPDGTGSLGKPLDSFTPADFQQLQNSDADLGSTAPAILPAPGYSGRLAVQGGKDSLLRLINLENLSGMGGPGHTGGEIQILNVPQGCEVLSAPAVWTNPADGSTWVFVANDCGISGLKLTVTAGVPSLSSPWQTGAAGFSPLVADNVLYFAGSGNIQALDPTTGKQLWSASIGGTHWESPVVANGVLYITDESGNLTAYTAAAITSLTPSPAPPKPVGTPITWTATALGGIAPLQYRFWRNFAAMGWSIVQDYSTSDTFSWTPLQAGSYDIAVWVRSAGSSNAFDAAMDTGYFSITSTVNLSSLSPSPAPPKPVGTVMTWTATATGGTTPLQYRFWRNFGAMGWSIVQDYSTGNSFSWTPLVAGSYDIAVWVKSAGSSNAFDAAGDTGYFNITSTVNISSLTPSPAPPEPVGTPITWTATATGGTAPLQYRFWRNNGGAGWIIVRDYSTSNSFSWTPLAAGSYDIAVWVRSAGSSNPFDAALDTGYFSITP